MTTRQNSSISSNSRTKLKNFRYIPSEESEMPLTKAPDVKVPKDAANADKENQKSWMNGVAKPPKSPSKSQPSTQPKDQKQTKECPKTPANRIPLADLISNAEDAMNDVSEKEMTPDDYISWQPAPPQSSSTTAGSKGRRKKRRHNSSPASSPLRTGKSSKPKEPFDLKTFQSLLKTPQSDIATDLWNNYVGKSKLEGALDIPAKFANLSSSPRTPISEKLARDSSGLRRSASCNVDWPSSKTKRRRIDGPNGLRTTRDIFSRSRSNVLDSGSSKKLSFLLDKIQNNLASAKVTAEVRSPSSPLPAQNDRHGKNLPSPSKGQRNCETAAGQHIPQVAMEGNKPADQPQALRKEKAMRSSSSEFSDDDFDEDILALVESSTDPFTDSENLKNTMPQTPVSRKSFNIEQSPCPIDNANKRTFIASKQGQSDDEFDDDLGEGMEEILAQYDEKKPPQHDSILSQTRPEAKSSNKPSFSYPVKMQEAQPIAHVSLVDEFDDDDLDLNGIDENALCGLDQHDQVGNP
ncbi:hypothetical protein BGW36DRAFT_168819 [Talaromyces proteolyticus]|uniref:Uncharacterized protein n=1 Tax=Talaromyces proteolyticus TaxID=1131652 RepID=A0AAD4Q0C3_9EURO|nr:uncharacterized protein BGW36DRAFT_168819 [Talaromyces proteolyticus]KAH8697502.1 hypothetical protein BGW36DRAFT_168819 [Talaromyces proteolyticus]